MFGILYPIAALFGKGIIKTYDSIEDNKSREVAKQRGDVVYTDNNGRHKSVETNKSVYNYKNSSGHYVWAECDTDREIYDETHFHIKKKYDEIYLPYEEKHYQSTLKNYFDAVENKKPYFDKHETYFNWNDGNYGVNKLRLRTNDGLVLKHSKETAFVLKFVKKEERGLTYESDCIHNTSVGSNLYEKETGLCVGITDIRLYNKYQPAFIDYNLNIINSEEIQKKMNMTYDELFDYAVSIGAILTKFTGYVGDPLYAPIK